MNARKFVSCAVGLFAAVALSAALPGCYDDEFPEIDAAVDMGPMDAAITNGDAGVCPLPAAADAYHIEMAYSPGHLHPGVVVTFTFTVTTNGAPQNDLSARVRYGVIGSGKTANFPLKAGTVPGTYTGVRVLSDPGAYEIFFEFTPCDTQISKRFTATIEAHP